MGVEATGSAGSRHFTQADVSTNPYRNAGAPPSLDDDVNEMIALGQATGLFATPALRRKMLLRESLKLVIALELFLLMGWDVPPIYLVAGALSGIAMVLADPWLRRRSVERALRHVPTIEPARRT